MATVTSESEGPWFIAEDAALDFINTLAMTDKTPQDFWQRDEDVQQWLRHAGWQVSTVGNPGELLAEARKLRALIRKLVEEKKHGQTPTVGELNGWLAQAHSHLQLTHDESGALQLQRVYRCDTVQQALAPVAERAATLLAEGQFDYIRQCEHPDCILWFYDKTKAHRRRWCSMALCGNRAKVARFRAKHVS